MARPSRDWQLPTALGRLRTRLSAHDDGDRQFVKVLAAALEDGLEAVEAACAEALECGACSADVVLNILTPAAPAGAAGGDPDARGPAASSPAGCRLPAL